MFEGAIIVNKWVRKCPHCGTYIWGKFENKIVWEICSNCGWGANNI
jgi:phage terminase large subunit GpA-like protein